MALAIPLTALDAAIRAAALMLVQSFVRYFIGVPRQACGLLRYRRLARLPLFCKRFAFAWKPELFIQIADVLTAA
ncbi:MAG: hypothetical protein Q7U42_13045, partial [Parvibaculum sp.]|nr:hypothetical protein [Parvibaculum sp.]